MMIATLGVFLIMALPFAGMIGLWVPTWVTVIALTAIYGCAGVFSFMVAGKWIAWPGLIAVALGIGMTTAAYDQRMINAADELGPIPAIDIEKHPDVLAYKFTADSFEVGEVEGWHEVCGEESCTEYVLLSLTFPGWTPKTSISHWFEVRVGDVFGPDYIFEKDTSSNSQEQGIRQACKTPARLCSENPTILKPISPEEHELLKPDTYQIFGLVSVFAWLFPCFIAWLVALVRRRF